MRRSILIVLAMSACCVCFSQSVQQVYNQAQEARKSGDMQKFYDEIVKAHKMHPYHQGILYQCGLAAALTGKPEESIDYLTRCIQIKADFDLSAEELKSLHNRDDFKKLKQLQTEFNTTILQSDTAFVIKNRTLHIESVAAGEASNIFYFGSIHKRSILRRDAKGNLTDFTASAQDGLTSVFGVKVDTKKKVLWACSSPMVEMENYDTTATSAVFKYDIKTNKLLAKYLPVSDKKTHVFGDLCLTTSGKVFVSDSENNIIFVVNEVSGKLEQFFSSEEFWNIQGITFSSDEKYLFISDYVKGPYRLDLISKELVPLKLPSQLSFKGIDGLIFYKNSLLAIQNATSPMRVTQYKLDASLSEITGYKIIDRAHPAFNEPTIGCVVGDKFYYVANSLWSGYTEDHRLKPVEQLQDVVILKMDLTKIK
jgi:hypothetical protein